MAPYWEGHEHRVVAVICIGEVAQLVGASEAVFLLRTVVLHLPAVQPKISQQSGQRISHSISCMYELISSAPELISSAPCKPCMCDGK